LLLLLAVARLPVDEDAVEALAADDVCRTGGGSRGGGKRLDQLSKSGWRGSLGRRTK
jgi:hypothetical protein